ncbi:hypothetical protein QBC47DRAFT_223205 [Echria macrotheca]|uniref:Uncharacterized protein n=1 Tax=Echria macrotheca TaxID=438768 RepID=A0AAJ0BF11_9PEZI|nr:hypothetical protein QBC47DRAFT_223205 [Echria macrotheca]
MFLEKNNKARKRQSRGTYSRRVLQAVCRPILSRAVPWNRSKHHVSWMDARPGRPLGARSVFRKGGVWSVELIPGDLRSLDRNPPRSRNCFPHDPGLFIPRQPMQRRRLVQGGCPGPERWRTCAWDRWDHGSRPHITTRRTLGPPHSPTARVFVEVPVAVTGNLGRLPGDVYFQPPLVPKNGLASITDKHRRDPPSTGSPQRPPPMGQ